MVGSFTALNYDIGGIASTLGFSLLKAKKRRLNAKG
jgi:hypothetical protein